MFLKLLIVAVVTVYFGESKVVNFHLEDLLRWKSSEVAPEGKHWALIVAGSKGWDNYRHQASACHAYQIMKKNGIPEENIVTMMYDDIAYNTANPTPGIIINRLNGPDVYGGVKIDYKGDDITAKNFLAVLSGNKDSMKNVGTGKVIESGPNDHIFVNYVDHGNIGILSFPDNSLLKATDLMATIVSMNKGAKYNQIVLYVEACYSGSMFENILPENINIYATTAANSHESSYACYFDQARKAFLGSWYGVNWMEDSDAEDLKKETLEEQFQVVKNKTKVSHVQEFGDMTVSNEKVAEFQGGETYRPTVAERLPKVPFDAVPQDEVELSILQLRLAKAEDEDAKQQLQRKIDDLLELRVQVAKTVKDIVEIVSYDAVQRDRIFSARYRSIDFDCYYPALKLFNERCYNVVKTDAARKQLKVFVNMCEEQIPIGRILEAIGRACNNRT